MTQNIKKYSDIQDVLIAYKGPITDVLIADTGQNIRTIFSNETVLCRKIFAIFMELAVNVFHYADAKITIDEENSASIGEFHIENTENELLITCKNKLLNKHIDELKEHCLIINSFDRDQLRKYKRDRRGGPRGNRSKGAGIGLIQVALTSDNKLDIEFSSLDNTFSFFKVTATIIK